INFILKLYMAIKGNCQVYLEMIYQTIKGAIMKLIDILLFLPFFVCIGTIIYIVYHQNNTYL
ncbi:MAG TPA: hypothetical protein VFF04_03090, partial [Candidatus Babeliales bacterium]|nr:hypothetical protein [Candidatus Babeliales bacterium]